MKKLFAYAFLLTATFAGNPECIRAADTNNFAAGTAEAKKENRDVLVYFTGSDWCAPAVRFKAGVLESPAIREALDKDFVFTEIDRRAAMTPEEIEADKKQNKELKISPRNYPEIILADAGGRIYAKIECRAAADLISKNSSEKQMRATTEGFLKCVAAMQKAKAARDASFAEAEKLAGVGKALALGRGLDALELSVAFTYEDEIKAISKADPEDKSGYVAKYTYQPNSFLEKQILSPTAVGKIEEARGNLEKMLANDKLSLDQRMEVLAAKVAFFKAQRKLPETVAALREMVALAPWHDLGQGARGYLDFMEKPVILKDGRWGNASCRDSGTWVLEATGVVTAPGRYEVAMEHTAGSDWQRVSAAAIVAGGEVLAEKKTDVRVGPGNKRLAWEFDLAKVPAGKKITVKFGVKCEGTWWNSEGVVSVKKL